MKTFATVCSGIGAPEVAVGGMGWRCVFNSEIEPFPCAVLAHHFPTVKNLGDITKFYEWPKRKFDVLIGGTPCQSFSVAGLRKGMDDPRGSLAIVFLGIVDKFRPTWVCWENVPGVHSSWSDEKESYPSEKSRYLLKADGLDPEDFVEVEQSNDFDCFISGLEQLGYGVAATILDAQFFGLAQRRKRVFVVGHIGGLWQRAAAVLFDASCVRGNNPPSREKGERPSPTISARTKGGGGLGTDAECDGALIAIGIDGGEKSHGKHNCDEVVAVPEIVSQAMSAKWSKGSSGPTGDEVANLISTPAVAKGMAVRRLTPKECCRLQGFPDDFLDIMFRGKPATDSHKYKALGNSMAVPVLKWICRRIDLVDELVPITLDKMRDNKVGLRR
jgi:DNA (cytosine-5)-methyltransferase 1